MKGAKKGTIKTETSKAVIPSPGPELRKRKATAEEAPSAKKASTAPSNASKVKDRMVKKLFASIKKTPHSSWQKKPYTEVVEGLDLEQAVEIIGKGRNLIGPGTKILKIHMEGELELREWLGVPTTVTHPVSDKGLPRYCFAGEPMPTIYLWAQIESLQVQYTKSNKVLSMKARTFLIGRGNPGKTGESIPAQM